MAKKQKFTVISPDGFPLERDAEYSSKEEAQDAIERFVDRYRTQGYYSTTVRVRIPIHEIEENCRLVEL
jgi:hypothetical protein